VHLLDFPKAKKELISTELNEQMAIVREIASLSLSLRDDAGIKIRQPLLGLSVWGKTSPIELKPELLAILAEEINVEKIDFKPQKDKEKFIIKKIKDLNFALDIEITPELKSAGILRELTRLIQETRKFANLNPDDLVEIFLKIEDTNIQKIISKNLSEFRKNILSSKITFEKNDVDFKKESKIDGKNIWIGIKK